jgi:hypothetical protein
MLQNPIYDPVALKGRLVQRHGVAVAELLFSAEVNRREIEDAQHTKLRAELAAIHNRMSELRTAAAQEQEQLQARLQEKYSEYLAGCDEAGRTDALAQAAIVPLVARSEAIQHQLRTLVEPRSTEQELRTLDAYNSTAAELLRSVDRVFPSATSRPLSEFELINLGLGKPRI